MASFQSLDVLLQDLESVEFDILKMFAMRPMPSSKMIDSKMVELVDSISRIPTQYEELVREWNGKASKLLEKFTEICMAQQSSVNVATGVKMPFDIGLSVGIDSSDRNNNELRPQAIMSLSAFSPLSSELEKQLISLEFAIEQMFSLSPVPLVDLNDRISQLMEATLKIPTEYMELSVKWSDKLANLLQKYDSVSSSTVPQSKNIFGYLPPVDNIASRRMPIHNEQTKPSSKSSWGKTSRSVAQEGNINVNGDTKYIQLMERTFGKLRQCDISDMTSLRKLLTLTAKAKAFSEHSGSNRSKLQTKCFSLALDKLPAQSQQEYSNQEGKKNLTTLASYLFGLIKADADNREQLQLAQSQSGDEYSNLFNCQYCKKTGHQVTFCPSRRATFCYNCFQFGHSMKRCPAEPFRPEDLARLF